MGSGGLNSTSGGGDETFEGGGVQASGEFLFLGFHTWDDGNGEEVFVDLAVEVEDLSDFRVGFFFGEEGGVAFLPEELSGPEEGFYGTRECEYG